MGTTWIVVFHHLYALGIPVTDVSSRIRSDDEGGRLLFGVTDRPQGLRLCDDQEQQSVDPRQAARGAPTVCKKEKDVRMARTW
jgi:hypothetical protein